MSKKNSGKVFPNHRSSGRLQSTVNQSIVNRKCIFMYHPKMWFSIYGVSDSAPKNSPYSVLGNRRHDHCARAAPMDGRSFPGANFSRNLGEKGHGKNQPSNKLTWLARKSPIFSQEIHLQMIVFFPAVMTISAFDLRCFFTKAHHNNCRQLFQSWIEPKHGKKLSYTSLAATSSTF